MKNGTLKHISLEGSRVADEGLESRFFYYQVYFSGWDLVSGFCGN